MGDLTDAQALEIKATVYRRHHSSASLCFLLSCLAMISTALGTFPNKRLGYENKNQSVGELVSEDNKRTFNIEQSATDSDSK